MEGRFLHKAWTNTVKVMYRVHGYRGDIRNLTHGEGQTLKDMTRARNKFEPFPNNLEKREETNSARRREKI